MHIGEVIKDLRKAKGVTQQEFANLCGMTQTHLSLVECGVRIPTFKTLTKIGKKLEIPAPIIIYLSIDIEDVPQSRREAFKILSPTIISLIKSIFLP